MDNAGIAGAGLVLELADGLKERLTFNVAYGAAYLDDGDFRAFPACASVEAALDFIGNMGDYLDGAAAEIPPAFLVQDGPLDLSGSDVGVFRQAFIDKALVMA